MQRQFTSGSRQAPDPFDQFLEENNFYRKHTARDSSCLFRVISEQMYDTQLHHLAIRKKCIRYMRKHREFFQPLVERDLDEYLDDMSKPKTYGSLVELQAVGYLFQRNVLLFEPFNLGNYYSSRSYFNDVFRVFYTPERHFDSVFTSDYIKDAAMCQSICYEILYKDLYKLPDVSFAVEHMLHSATFESSDYNTDSNDKGYCTRLTLADGRTFDFDLPQDTNCILENYKLCHFHYSNFPRLSDDLQRELKVYANRAENDKNALCKTAESLLPNKYVSCVRQLLQEGITPFPYKVAKALDPNMYRNIEFDAWNEHRKEIKLQNWYNGDANFKVGAKCHVKLCKSEKDLYTCHIQEIAVDKGYCVVFIEQLGEKRLVPYESLTPLPPDQFKPWTLPYRFQRQMQKYSSVRFTRHYNYRFKFDGQFSSTQEFCAPLKSHDYADPIMDDPKQHYANTAAAQHRNSCYYNLKQFTQLENFRAHAVEYCTMPLTYDANAREADTAKGSQRGTPANDNALVAAGEANGKVYDDESSDACERSDLERSGSNDGVLVPEFHGAYPISQYAGAPEAYYDYCYDYGAYPANALLTPAGPYYYMCSAAPPLCAANPGGLYLPGPPGQPAYPAMPTSVALPNVPVTQSGGTTYYTNPAAYCTSMLNVPPSLGAKPAGSPNLHGSHSNMSVSGRGGGRMYNSATTPLSGRINYDARKSQKANGMDLPTDIATLRFFYNLGVEFHHRNRQIEDGTVDSKEGLAKVIAEVQSNKYDKNGNIIEGKLDVNGNVTSSNSMHGNSNSSQKGYQSQEQPYSGGQGKGNHRRFPPRFFNSNRDRSSAYIRNQGCHQPNTGPMQQGRHQNDYNNNTGGTVNKNTYHVKGPHGSGAGNAMHNSTGHHLPNANAGGNAGAGSGAGANEQGAQNAAMSASYEGNNTAGGGESAQMPPTYLPTSNAVVAYGSYDVAGGDPNVQGPSAAAGGNGGGGGVYIHMPVASGPYGLYAAAPPPPLAQGMIHPQLQPPHLQHGSGAAFAPFMANVPMPAQMLPHQPASSVQCSGSAVPTQAAAAANGFFAAPNSEGMEVGNANNENGIQYQCMSYPPPMPLYYAPSAANAAHPNGATVIQQHPPNSNMTAGGGNGPPPPLAPQAYWCVQPNAQAPSNIMVATPNAAAAQAQGAAGGVSANPPNVNTAANND